MSQQEAKDSGVKSDLFNNSSSSEVTDETKKTLFDYDTLPVKPRSSLPRKMPKPHRCNNHMEDFIQGMFYEPREIYEPFKVWLKCVQSEEGQEPTRFSLKNGRNF
ncbi:hypothetical protein DSO57_1039540 [Entomophthora muscae]|uniref:Uncharacterized protein n=1 Tax=Entomophthora muscae TaxID=34485 RepID=A0ACC2TX64_9FUNG|nr:hypothetical protein DSO57_1039540 [Entomophthora muscae]